MRHGRGVPQVQPPIQEVMRGIEEVQIPSRIYAPFQYGGRVLIKL